MAMPAIVSRMTRAREGDCRCFLLPLPSLLPLEYDRGMDRFHISDWPEHLRQIPEENLADTAQRFRETAANFSGIGYLPFRWSMRSTARQVDRELRRRLAASDAP